MPLLISQPEFGQRLKSLRQARGLSQRDVAGSSISASYVSLLEAGHRMPTAKVAADLASALGIGRAELTDNALPDVDPPRAPIGGEHDRLEVRTRVQASDDRLVERVLTDAAVMAGDAVPAVTWAEAAYRRAGDSGAPERVVDTGLALCRVLSTTDLRARRDEVLAEIVHTAERAGLSQMVVSVLVDQASAARGRGELRRALSLVERAGARLPATRFAGTVEEVRLVGVHAAVLCDLGDAAGARELLPGLLQLARTLGGGVVLGRAEWIAALTCSRLGDRAALAHLERARHALDTSMPIADWLRFCRAAAWVILDVGGDVEEAAEFLHVCHCARRTMRTDRDRYALDVLGARIALTRGDPVAARSLCADVLAAEHGLTGHELLQLHRTLATAAVRLEDRATALRELRVLASTAETEGMLSIALEAWKELETVRGAER